MASLPYRLARQMFFVGASEYFETSVTRWLARQVNLVPVDPDAALVSAMQAGAAGLREGRILVLFPEGERAIDGTVRNFKKGAAILGHHLDVPLVPVALDRRLRDSGRATARSTGARCCLARLGRAPARRPADQARWRRRRGSHLRRDHRATARGRCVDVCGTEPPVDRVGRQPDQPRLDLVNPINLER